MTKIKFNEQQQEAVDFKNGACSVIANAGSGKTSVLLGRVENLVKNHKISEKDILTITFTRNTANDLINELTKRDLHFVNVGTFHSICGQILRQEGININPSNMVQEWQIDNCFREIDQNVDATDVMNFISYQKNYNIGENDKFKTKASSYSEEELREFYKAYEDMKKKFKKYDFDDYLLLCLDILKKSPGKYTFKYILVDEHQDSNTIQNELLKHWHIDNNVFVVNDPKQSLYGFRGGNPEYSMNFGEYWDDATIINIDTNYRSKKNIIEKSNDFIKQYYSNFSHYADSIPFHQDDGLIDVSSHESAAHEANYIVNNIEKLISDGTKLNDIAVLFRKNKHADYIENELKRKKIDYEVDNDSSFFNRREIKGIMSFLRLIMNKHDNNAMESIFKFRVHPLKFFSNVLISSIKNHANANKTSLFEAMLQVDYPQAWNKTNAIRFADSINKLQGKKDGDVKELINDIIKTFKIRDSVLEKYSHIPEREERLNSLDILKGFINDNDLKDFIDFVYSGVGDRKKKKDDAIKLMTIHRSKGLEFDNVFVVGVQDTEFPVEREGEKIDIVEEANLFYVGVTRSKENLWVSEIGKNNRFIEEYGYVDNINV